jgi:quercetin 2,3-dioxygenase
MTAEFATAGAERFTLPGEPLPFFLREGEGERAHLFDSLVTVLLSKDETEGQFGVFTLAAPRGEAIPTHTHADVHEIFFVLGVCTGGFERFFAAAGTRTDSRALPRPPYVPPVERLTEAGREFGNEFRFDVRLDG